MLAAGLRACPPVVRPAATRSGVWGHRRPKSPRPRQHLQGCGSQPSESSQGSDGGRDGFELPRPGGNATERAKGATWASASAARSYPLDDPLWMRVVVRNRLGIPQRMPGDLYHEDRGGAPSFRRGDFARLRWMALDPLRANDPDPFRDKFAPVVARSRPNHGVPIETLADKLGHQEWAVRPSDLQVFGVHVVGRSGQRFTAGMSYV